MVAITTPEQSFFLCRIIPFNGNIQNLQYIHKHMQRERQKKQSILFFSNNTDYTGCCHILTMFGIDVPFTSSITEDVIETTGMPIKIFSLPYLANCAIHAAFSLCVGAAAVFVITLLTYIIPETLKLFGSWLFEDD